MEADMEADMEAQLFNAARQGNTNALRNLLESEPLLLEVVATASAGNPLHIASMLGHLDFVRELLGHEKNSGKYAKELNQYGYSPMHLAAANGHVQVVEMLLRISRELCCVKGKDGVTPLHCASVKGRAQVISRLLSDCPLCVEEVNARNETALHVAVKNNQFESLRTLVEGLRQSDIFTILNSRDVEGNTVLHLAAAHKNHQAVELLVNYNDGIPRGLEVLNATNKSGLTALDLFILCPCESESREATMVLLRRLGAVRAQDLHRDPQTCIALANPNTHDQAAPTLPHEEAPSRSAVQDANLHRDETTSSEGNAQVQLGRANPSDVRSALLVVAVLMATATYEAALKAPVLPSNSSYFMWFMVANTAGFYASINMIDILTCNFPLKLELCVTGFAMGVTYASAMITQAPEGPVKNTFILLSIIMPLAIPIFRCIKTRILQHIPRSGANRRHQNA